MPDPIHVSAKQESMASAKKHLLATLNPGTWSIKWKVRLNFFLRAVVAIGLMVSMINLFQRRLTLREINDKLQLVSEIKSDNIQVYFANLQQQLSTFSADRHTIEAFNQLSIAFQNIENDNYLTTTASSPDKINLLLDGFYSSEVLPVLARATESGINLQTLVPADNRQRILQYLYLAANSRPLGAKGAINKADDASNYSFLHAQYHPEMLNFAREAGIADLLFVDYKSGYVTYSTRKNLDFATNLFEGPYKSSGLGLAFKSALGQRVRGGVSYIDASLYVPALMQPTVFMATPVYNGSELIGAAVLALGKNELNNLLKLEKGNIATGESLKTIIVGSDLLYRNDDPDFLANSERYIKKLKRHAHDGKSASTAELLGTTAMVQSVDPSAFSDAIKGKENLTHFTSETGESVLCSFVPLKVNDLNWILVTLIDRSEAMSAVRNFTLVIFGIALLIAGLLYYMSAVTSNAISDRVIRLKNTILDLARGEKIEEPKIDSGDEIGQAIGAVGKLSRRMQEATLFIASVSKGSIEGEFIMNSETDQYGLALNNLKSSLAVKREEEEKRQKEDEIRNWTSQGIATFNDILRSDNHDLEKLALNIIRNVIQYLSANQGGLFLIEDDEGEKYLNLIAAYAYDRQKFMKKKIAIGEGLAGNCVLEKKTVLLNKIPDNYIEISSGLGKSKPGCLIIVPLKKEEEVLGVLELASFNDFKPHEVEFLEKLAESIASSLITVRLHQQTSTYLQKFQQQAEEMKAQEEELRQNIEELQATHEQMERLKREENERNEQMIRDIQKKQKELEEEKALLDALLNNVPECIYFKDKESRFIRFSKSMLDLFGLKHPEELTGKSDFDFFDDAHARPAYEDEQNIIKTGKAIIDLEEKEVMEDGRITWVNTTKMPLRNANGEIVGTFGISKSITRIKNMELEAREMMKTIEGNRKLLIDILNKIPAKVFLKDENGVFVVVNNAVASVYDKKPEEIIGTSDYDNHPDEDVDSWRAQELEIIQKGETTYLHKESLQGKTSYLKTTKMPFTLATTGKTGLLGIQFDVTDLKVLEEKVHELKEEVERLKK